MSTQSQSIKYDRRAWGYSHLFVRLVSAIALANLALGAVSTSYFHLVTGVWLGRLAVAASMLSCFLLPLYVGFEVWWMRKSRSEVKALWVDVVFAVASFLFYWFIVLYAFNHHAII